MPKKVAVLEKAKIETPVGGNGHPAETNRKTKLCIVGFAPTWPKAPYEDESFEIWACNEFHILNRRVDVLFELHSRNEIEQKERDKVKQEHLNWMRQAKIPIFMIQHFDDIPQSIPYPWQHIIEKFGTYFTNTISLQIALAIDLGFKEIHLYGVNMANDEEYAGQRPSVEYFVGLARGMGITVFVPDESDILKSWTIYGKDDESASIIQKRLINFKDEKQNQRAQAEGAMHQNMAIMHQCIGSIQATDYILSRFLYPNATFNELLKPKEK